MALGPGLSRGRLEHTVSIMDFAPTFCALLGTTLPEADGEVITELLDGSPAFKPVRSLRPFSDDRRAVPP